MGGGVARTAKASKAAEVRAQGRPRTRIAAPALRASLAAVVIRPVTTAAGNEAVAIVVTAAVPGPTAT